MSEASGGFLSPEANRTTSCPGWGFRNYSLILSGGGSVSAPADQAERDEKSAGQAEEQGVEERETHAVCFVD